MNKEALIIAVTEAIDDDDIVTVAVKNGELFTGTLRIVEGVAIVTSVSDKKDQTVIGADAIVYITVRPRSATSTK